MFSAFRQYWQQLRESLWFVPGLLVLGAIGLAYALVLFDTQTSFDGSKRFPLLFGAGAEGSRGMLSSIASSMLTVAALVFTLTLNAITQVSSQYSPRVLRNFMRDRGNQVVMGYFVGVFTYCLLVLGTIRGSDEDRFVPATAVLVGLVLALGGVVALIYFIHHIAESLQTGTILKHIADETGKAIDTLFPEELGEPAAETPPANNPPDDNAPDSRCIAARQTGYLQRIDTDGLLRWASSHKALVRVEQPLGAFISTETPLLRVQSAADEPGSDPTDTLLDFLTIGRHRSVEQDVAFGLQQLVDIGLKALSPGVNDTTTAIMAIDHLGALMSRLAGRPFPADWRADDEQVRVRVKAPDFADYVALAFDLLRINAQGNHAVCRRLLRALADVDAAACSGGRRVIVRRQLHLLLDYAEQTLATDYEKEQVRALYKTLVVGG